VRLERLELLGLTLKKPSQGKMEQPEQLVLPDRLERPAPPVRLEQRVATDDETDRGLIALSCLGELKRGRECILPLF